MKRASKRLITSIIALVASVILCIGVCLAWFSMNNDVSGNGMQTQVKGDDIIDFQVNAYYLDFNDSNKSDFKLTGENGGLGGNVSTSDKTFDKNGNGTFNVSSDGNDEMRSFDSTKMYSSAVLFKVYYKIMAGSDKSFRIYATCPYTTKHLTENVFTVIKSTAQDEADTYYSSVSNAVFLSEASLVNGKYTYDSANKVKFIKESDSTKYFTRELKTGIKSTSDSIDTEATLYFIMDYDETLFNALSAAMLKSGGALNSRLTLDGDVILGIEEYDENAADPTVNAVTFVNSTSVTTQAAGTDVMTSSWQFLLKYSDNTLETVKYNASAFTIDESFSTTSTGSKTVTITYGGITVQYKPKDGEASNEIPYTIEEATTVNGITLNTYSLSLTYDVDNPGTAQLTATVSPSNANNKTVIWSSSNIEIASVSSTGLVTATGVGTAKITAMSDANNSIKTECTVTVTAASSSVPVTGVALDNKTLALVVNSPVSGNDKATLKATISPSNATNKGLTWASSDSSVATVDNSGNVTAHTAGTTNITVTTSDGGFVAICSVIVTDHTSSVPVTSVSLNATELSLTVGGTETLKATISPSNATITTVSWKTSDNTVATVSGGVVTAVKAGTATITVKASGYVDDATTPNLKATCTVTVTGSTTVPVTGVTLNKESTTITVGSTETLTATVLPSNATNQKVSWESSNASVATVDENGKVSAVAQGTAIITVTTEDGSKTATCTVTVAAERAYDLGTFTLTFNGQSNVSRSEGSTDTAANIFTISGEKFSYSGSTLKLGGNADTVTVSVKVKSGQKITLYFEGWASGGTATGIKVNDGTWTVDYPANSTAVVKKTIEYTATADGIVEFTLNRLGVTGTMLQKVQVTVADSVGGESVTPSSIALASGNTTFKKGSTASTSDWSFTVTYSDSTSKTVAASNVSIGEIDTSASGSVSVSYTENGTTINTTVNYTVQAPTAITFKSGTTSFKKGSTPSTSDWKFTVAYGSLAPEEVGVSAVTLSADLDTSTAGTKSVTATLTGTTLTVDVEYTVQAPTAITFKSGTTSFTQNVAASTADWKFTVAYGSLAPEEVGVSAVTLSADLDTSTAGTKSVTVTLTGTELTCTVTYSVTAAGVADGTYTFNKTDGTANSSNGFEISNGNYTTSANVTYNGTTYTNALKMEQNTSVAFTLGSAKTVRLVTSGKSQGIKIDGASKTTESNGILTIELAAGKHTITKDDSINLVLIIIGYKAVPVTSVTITGDSVVVAGRTITLTATVLPADAENKSVTWAIKSGSEYATINSSTGVLTAKAEGTVTVTATAGGVTSEGFGVTINAAELEKLTHSGTTTFKKGSSNPTSDWVFTATYSDGTTKDVTSSVSLSGTVSTDTVGNSHSVTASYTENGITKECTVSYKVIEPKSIAYVNGTGTTSFTQNVAASTDGWQFTVTYTDDSTTETITAPDSRLTIGEIDTTTPTDSGSVAVSYTENDTTVSCNVPYTVSGGTTPEKATASNFSTGTDGSVAKGATFYTGTSFSITLTGGTASLSEDKNGATADDGEKFTQGLLPGGSGRIYEITAIKNVKLKVYLTIAGSSWASQKGNVTLNGTAVSELSFSTTGTDTSKAYCLEIELTAGASAKISSSSGRLALYGVYGEYTK